MMSQRRMDELKIQAIVRIREKLTRFYTSYYGPRAVASAMQPMQPQMPQQMPGPEMMGAPNGKVYGQGG